MDEEIAGNNLKRLVDDQLTERNQNNEESMRDRKKRTNSTSKKNLLLRLLRQTIATSSSSSTAISGPGGGTYATGTSYGTPTSGADYNALYSTTSGNYSVGTVYGPDGNSISGGIAQYLVIPASNVYSYCNFVFNGSPIRFTDPVVNGSLWSFLGELGKNGGVLSMNQSCLLLYYWRKRVESATSTSPCGKNDSWCTLGATTYSSRPCTPLFCTKNPGAPCLSNIKYPSTCKMSFPIKCIIHCLKLNIRTSDPLTLTNVINQLDFQKLTITTRSDHSSYVKGNFLSSLLKKRHEREKKQAMALSCGTCGCASGGYSCDACYTNAPNGAPCWDPWQNADCCMCLVLG